VHLRRSAIVIKNQGGGGNPNKRSAKNERKLFVTIYDGGKNEPKVAAATVILSTSKS
jgi:hypothetical protein